MPYMCGAAARTMHQAGARTERQTTDNAPGWNSDRETSHVCTVANALGRSWNGNTDDAVQIAGTKHTADLMSEITETGCSDDWRR